MTPKSRHNRKDADRVNIAGGFEGRTRIQNEHRERAIERRQIATSVQGQPEYVHADFVPQFGQELRRMSAAVAMTIANRSNYDTDDIYAREALHPEVKDSRDLLTADEAQYLPIANGIMQAVTELVWESFTADGPAREAPHVGEYLK